MKIVCRPHDHHWAICKVDDNQLDHLTCSLKVTAMLFFVGCRQGDCSETQVMDIFAALLKCRFNGDLLTADMPEFRETMDKLASADPLVIARPSSPADVVTCVKWAASCKMAITCIGGGYVQTTKHICSLRLTCYYHHSGIHNGAHGLAQSRSIWGQCLRQ